MQKRNVVSLERKSAEVMDDESSESMEPMKEVPFVGLRVDEFLNVRSKADRSQFHLLQETTK